MKSMFEHKFKPFYDEERTEFGNLVKKPPKIAAK